MTRKGLSRAQVAKAALAVADSDGLSAVTMRRVGQECGVEAMSLYTYVSSKSDLWLAMIEERHGSEAAERLTDPLKGEASPERDAAEAAAGFILAAELSDSLTEDVLDWPCLDAGGPK